MRKKLAALVLLALAIPIVARGDGVGSDDQGDYNYRWMRLRFARFSVEVHWWPE